MLHAMNTLILKCEINSLSRTFCRHVIDTFMSPFFMHVNLHVDIPILHDIHCVSCKKYLTYRNRRTSQYDQYFETISVCTKAYFLC